MASPPRARRARSKIIERVDEQAGDNVRIFAFGVGYDVNTLLLDTITQGHHGTSAYVRPAEDIEQAVSSFYDKIGTPVLTDVTVGFGSLNVQDTFPYPLPDLFAGNQVVVVGRYRQGGKTSLTLQGAVNGGRVTYEFEDVQFRDRGGEEFIPRLWATRKVGYLLTQIRLHGADSELVDEIVDLSVRYGIVTPYTSFLIDETEDALTAEGRNALAQKQVARAAAPYGLGGKGTATPAPSVSGAKAVEESIAQEALRQADVAAPAEHQQVRTVGDKTFVLREGIWTDTLYDAATAAGAHQDRADRLWQHPLFRVAASPSRMGPLPGLGSAGDPGVGGPSLPFHVRRNLIGVHGLAGPRDQARSYRHIRAAEEGIIPSSAALIFLVTRASRAGSRPVRPCGEAAGAEPAERANHAIASRLPRLAGPHRA